MYKAIVNSLDVACLLSSMYLDDRYVPMHLKSNVRISLRSISVALLDQRSICSSSWLGRSWRNAYAQIIVVVVPNIWQSEEYQGFVFIGDINIHQHSHSPCISQIVFLNSIYRQHYFVRKNSINFVP